MILQNKCQYNKNCIVWYLNQSEIKQFSVLIIFLKARFKIERRTKFWDTLNKCTQQLGLLRNFHVNTDEDKSKNVEYNAAVWIYNIIRENYMENLEWINVDSLIKNSVHLKDLLVDLFQ